MSQLSEELIADHVTEGFLWDSDVPGFGVRIYSSGRKSFVFRYYEGDRRLVKVLGPITVLSVSEARATARALFLKQLRSHHATGSNRSFGEFSNDYLEHYAKIRKKSWRDESYMLQRHVLPVLGSEKLTEITRRDVEFLFGKLSLKHPVMANRVLSLLKLMFKLAVEWGECFENPATKIAKNHEQSRDVFIRRNEFPRLVEAMRGEPFAFRAAILLLLLTGFRKAELLSLPWRNVDLEAGNIVIERPKNRRRLYLPLSSLARRIISSVPRDGEYVFARGDTHLKDFKRRWCRVRERAGLPHIHVHDLRRTMGSWLAQAGLPIQLIGDALNHVDPRSTAVYVRFQQEHLRQALEMQAEMVQGPLTESFKKLVAMN